MCAPILVVQHGDDCPPARLGRWLSGAGHRLTVVRGHRGEPVPATLDGFAALVVLGGQMGAYDDARYPWLTPTKALLAAAVEGEVPALGVCLGHQLLAVATGGTVAPCPDGQQAGLFGVGLTEAGRRDRLLRDLGEAPVVHWNSDVVVAAPPGATVLARSAAGIQALGVGSAVGVQFHPEADSPVVAGWAAADVAGGRTDPGTAEVRLAEIRAADEATERMWSGFATRFAAEVAGSSRPVPR